MKKILPLIILFLFSFSTIHADDFKWELSADGTLTISGTSMTDYEPKSTPWYDNRHKIKKVVIKDGVTNIGINAFDGCTGLSSIEIPNSVTRIGFQAFRECYALTSVTIPNSVTSIEPEVFRSCSSLTSVEIPNSVTSIGSNAFYGCEDLTSVTIGNSVTRIEECTFSNCSALTSITVEKGNTKYDSRDNCNAIIETNTNKLIIGCKNTVIPNSVTSIGDYAFCHCRNLTSIEIPNSVKSIEDFAFKDCNNLTSVVIPNFVTSIGFGSFLNCDELASITFKGSTPPAFGDNVFNGISKSVLIYVPANSIEEYKNVLGDDFPNIQANPKQLFLTGNNFYLQDSQIDGTDVSFTRDFTTNWEAIYLPFSLKYEDWKDDFEVARINGIHQYDKNDDGRIDKTELEFVKMTDDESVIYPNTPYLIKAKKAGEKTLSVENTTVYKADVNQIECSTTTEKFIFRGNYRRIISLVIETEGYYIIENGQLNNKPVYSLGSYRWYMKRENRNSAYGINNNNTAKEISIRVVGEETTGIANIQLTSPNTQTYDLNGRRVNENNLKPGMYVKNGRKFVVK